MKPYTRTPWITAVLAAGLLAATATAADPAPKDAKDGKDKEAPAKVDKDVEAWINVLAAKIADRHDSIRESARHALIAMGKAALPALQKLADGSDGAAAEAAQHVIARIEGGEGHHGFEGRHGFRGRHGFDGRWGHEGHEGFGGRHDFGRRWGHEGFKGPEGREGGHGSHGEMEHRPGAPGAGPHPGGPAGRLGAGGFGPPMSGPAAMIERALKDLNLTDAQKDKVKEVVKAQAEKAREALEKMHDDFMKAMKGVIDEEQFKKLEKSLPKPPEPGDQPRLASPPKPPKK